jgi:hypothetical protein
MASLRTNITGLLGFGILAYLAFNAVQLIATGVYVQTLKNEQYFGVTPEMEKRGQESTFKVLCVEWKDAGTLERMTTLREYGWCKDYVHRM